MLRQLQAFRSLNLALSHRFNTSGIEKLRNLGIAAHVDSGKTTVSERLLYYSGKIGEIHEVKGKDKVGATMDHMELERERGITIQSAATSFDWKGHAFNLIDTPGHVDFTVEVERSLRVLDGAVLVVCASGGIQSQTITVHRQMKRYDIPTIAFINKLDRLGANPVRCLDGIRERLGRTSAFLQLPIGLESNCKGIIDLIERRAVYFDGESGETVRYEAIPKDQTDLAEKYRTELIENLADVDEEIGEMFLMEEEPSVEQINAAIRRSTISLDFTPVMMGTALRNKGVQELMDATVKYLPDPSEVENRAKLTDKELMNKEPEYDEDGELIPIPEESVIMNPTIIREEMDKLPGVGLAFKLDTTPFGQLTYIRMYQGKFSKGDNIINTRTGERIRVSKMVKMHSNKMDPTDKLVAGDIAGFFGVDCASGDTFVHQSAIKGGKVLSMESIFVPNPVVSLSIQPKNKDADSGARFRKALIRFSKEDPTFVVRTDEDTEEMVISGMGELHLEVYAQRMEREYNCPVILGRPKVLWYEALIQDTKFDYTHKRQSGGRGQFGRAAGSVTTTFDPKVGNQDVNFRAQLLGDGLSRNYVKPIEKGMRSKLGKGGLITGSRVVGFNIVLEDGAEHMVDSSEHAFYQCGEGCMEQVIRNSALKLIGPFMKLEVACPREFQNKVIQLLSSRYSDIKETRETLDYVTFDCEVLLYDMFGFTADLRSNTEGKGEYTMEFLRYDYVSAGNHTHAS